MGRAKRILTSRLPSDWREQVWQSISETNTALLSAAAILQLTGCRPWELAKGVAVELNSENPVWGEVLLFTIEGAKVGTIPDRNGKLHDRGQPERNVVVPITSPPAKHLANLITKFGRQVISYHAKSISNRVSEISRLLYPRRREHISAYCYRHAFCTDIKDSVPEANTRAAALGHLSDFSQGSYGRPSKGGKGVKTAPILDAIGSRQVKHSKKSDRLLRFKIASKNNAASKKIINSV